MPIGWLWWVAFVSAVCLAIGFYYNIDGLKFAGVLVLIGPALGLLRALLSGLFRRR
jgi:hypothetical protein